jgi:Cft2 family RNA processing exonuclease
MHIGLDSPEGDISFLSHAHSDHTNGLKRLERIISTEATLDLAGINAKLETPLNTKLLDAGHILGARQLAIESDGERVVYTGDFCLKPNVFGMKAEIPRCDRLIMEATYGDPAYVFPPLEDTHHGIHRWVRANERANLVIGCYELGKAQEVIKVLNECGIAPIVTPKTESFCSVYGKHGLKLERIVVGSWEAEEAMSRPFVAIVPMGKAKRYFAKRLAEAFERDTLCAVATGWALHYRFNADAAFPLSDHADFSDLVHFVEQSGAKKVEFFCGDGSSVLEGVRARNGAVLNL